MILDTQVLEVIKNHPGITAYDIRNEYLVGYKVVRIRRAVNRLLSKNKIEVVGFIRQGKTRSSYYNKLEIKLPEKIPYRDESDYEPISEVRDQRQVRDILKAKPKPKPLSPLGKQVYSNPMNRLLNGQW